MSTSDTDPARALGGVGVLARTAGAVLDRALAEHSNQEALVGRDRRLSYVELDSAADLAASALRTMGIRQGDRVAVSLPNSTEIVVLFHAMMRLGAIWVGINLNLAPPEKEYILTDSQAALFVANETDLRSVNSSSSSACEPISQAELLGKVVRPKDYPRPGELFDEPAGVAYTSGTTGRPKGVVHSHRNLLLPGAVLLADRGDGSTLRRGDCAALTILNLQITSTLLTAQAMGTQIVMDRVDPEGIAEWIRRERINSWFGVPTMLQGLATTESVRPADLATLDDIWTGGADIPDSIRHAFERKFGRAVHATYGLTEVPTVVSIQDKGGIHRPGSSGRILRHLSIEIRPDTSLGGSSSEGEVLVAGRHDGPWADAYRSMLGYHGNPEQTEAALGDGWLHTGDVGVIDHGELYVHGRRTSLILRGGANVYPAEVERVILEVPGVVGAAVVGIPDERLGQRVAAAIEVAPGANISDSVLSSHCRGALARDKVPDHWIVRTLPRNAMGKVLYPEVVTWFSTE